MKYPKFTKLKTSFLINEHKKLIKLFKKLDRERKSQENELKHYTGRIKDNK